MKKNRRVKLETMTKEELIHKAGLGRSIVAGNKYHPPLPPELEQWYCYMKDGGHCILVLRPGCHGRVAEHIIPVPVKAVLKRRDPVQDGYIRCRIPYSGKCRPACDVFTTTSSMKNIVNSKHWAEAAVELKL